MVAIQILPPGIHHPLELIYPSTNQKDKKLKGYSPSAYVWHQVKDPD